MQYLVYSKGKVVENQEKAYVIKANSIVEAQNIAKETFSEEYCVIDEEIYTKPYKRTRNSILAYVFMTIPILLSFINWKSGHETIKISPDYISCTYALIFYAAYIVRFKGIMRTMSTWVDIGFCVFLPLLLATFIRTLMGTTSISILGCFDIPIDTSVVFPFAILLSWLGLKMISVICIACIGVLALFNITVLSESMGTVWGPIYIISAFIGILLYCSIEPALVEGLPHFGRHLGQGSGYMKKDFVEAGKSAKKIGNSVSQYAKDKTSQLKDTRE